MVNGDGRPVQADRRLNLRSPMIVLEAKFEDGRKTFFGYAKNISRGGMFISSINPKDPGSQFLVELPLPDPINQKVQCSCEVVWNRRFSDNAVYEPGMGLKFLNLSDEMADAIDAWVNSSRPDTDTVDTLQNIL
jgi:uncharacterized protein (TIGR02266 family)